MSIPIDLRTLLPPAHILLITEHLNKKRVFEQAALLMENIGPHARNDLFREFMQRERQGSTSIGFYGAIPHVRLDIGKPLCVLARLKKPIQYDADNAPTSLVHTLFFLLAPASNTALHLNLLALFSHLLADEPFMKALDDCSDADAISREIGRWQDSHQDTLNELFCSDG